MGNKGSKGGKLSKVAAAQSNSASVSLSPLERVVLNSARSQEKETPHVNLKYYDSHYQCFSAWSSDELSAFSAFIEKMKDSKWQGIYKTAGKSGTKTGFGYTIHKDLSKLPKKSIIDSISPDVTYFELRVTQQARVHGFRLMDAFYLIWLDRSHDVYKS